MKVPNSMILTIIVNDSPYGIEKPWNALRLASTTASDGIEVRLFLMGDSVASAKKGRRLQTDTIIWRRCFEPLPTKE